MQKYKYVIVEDHQSSIDHLCSRLDCYSEKLQFVGAAMTGHDAIDLIQQRDPDLVFMDIQMPGFDGFQILEAFENPRFQVIFSTGFSEQDYLMRAIRNSAIDYILKPYPQEEVNRAVERFLELVEKDSSLRIEHLIKYKSTREIDRMIIPLFKSYKIVMFEDIVHLEARRGSYVIVHVNNGEHFIATRSMSFYEDMLPDSTFFRSHKSHAINLYTIEKVDSGNGGFVYLKNGAVVPVAFRRKAELLRRLKEFIDPDSLMK